jgi:hypothetical protein
MLAKESLSSHLLLRWQGCMWSSQLQHSCLSNHELTYTFSPSPIFFQTTYFSDYILVPQKSIRTVTKTLEERGFTFSPSAAAYVSQHSPSSPISPRRTRQSGSGNPFDFPSTLTARPNTPPASNINELQAQTFAKLRRAGIIPTVDRSIRLVSCAARRETNPALDAQLRNDLLQILLATCPETRPHHATETKASASDFSTRFLSLTLTSEEPISLLLESFLLSNPNLSLSSTLLFSQLSSPSIPAEEAGSGGTGKDVLIPITLDLRDLPLDATGIVCGVAGRLAQGTASQSPPSHPLDPSGSKARQSSVMGEEGDEEEGSLSPKTSTIETVLASQIAARPGPGQVDRSDERHDATVVVEISFLSTARAGTVIVRERELERAIRALDAGAEMVHLDHNGGEGGSQAER